MLTAMTSHTWRSFLQEVAESVLNNRGMAISIMPQQATLPPFGTARFTLKLMSNMIGTYEDILECRIGTEAPDKFRIRAGIIGSPVHLQKEASLVKGLFVRNSTQSKVDFGIVPKGVQVTRSVSVFNLSSFEVGIAFHLEVFERSPLHDWTSSHLHVRPDDTVALTVRCDCFHQPQIFRHPRIRDTSRMYGLKHA